MGPGVLIDRLVGSGRPSVPIALEVLRAPLNSILSIPRVVVVMVYYVPPPTEKEPI